MTHMQSQCLITHPCHSKMFHKGSTRSHTPYQYGLCHVQLVPSSGVVEGGNSERLLLGNFGNSFGPNDVGNPASEEEVKGNPTKSYLPDQTVSIISWSFLKFMPSNLISSSYKGRLT